MERQRSNIYGYMFWVLFSVFALQTIIFFDILPRYYPDDSLGSFKVFRGILWLVFLALLVTSLILYTRRENQIRESFWRKSEIKNENTYAKKLLGLLLLLLFGGIFIFGVIPKYLSHVIPQSLNFIAINLFLLGSAAVMAGIIIAGYEQDRLTAQGYIDLVRKLGADEQVISKQKIRKRKSAGIWAKVSINYKNHDFMIAGEDTKIPDSLSLCACLLITMNKEGIPASNQHELIASMAPETKVLFDEMQHQVRRVYLSCPNHKLSLRIPMAFRCKYNSLITPELLRTAMDILLGIT